LRQLVSKDALHATASHYETLLDGDRDIHMPIPQWNGLEIIVISNVILIASDTAFTTTQRRTLLSAIVGNIHSYALRPEAEILPGCEIEPIPPGVRARCDFGLGIIVEAVEHCPLPGETAIPPIRRPSNAINLTINTTPVRKNALITALAHAHHIPPPAATSGPTSIGNITVTTNLPAPHRSAESPVLQQLCAGIQDTDRRATTSATAAMTSVQHLSPPPSTRCDQQTTQP